MSLTCYTNLSLLYNTTIPEHFDAFSPILTWVQKFRRHRNHVIPFATTHQQPPPLPNYFRMQLSETNSSPRAVFTSVLCACVRAFGEPLQIRPSTSVRPYSNSVLLWHASISTHSTNCYPPNKIRWVGHVESTVRKTYNFSTKTCIDTYFNI